MQAASPIEIYRQPADAFVADFIGIDQSARRPRPTAPAASRCSGTAIAGLAMPAGQSKATLSIRPEDVHLGAPARARITGKVTFVRDLGGTIETFVEVGGTSIVAVSTPRERHDVTGRRQVGVIAAARKLRGARAHETRSPKALADYTPLFFPALMLIVFFVVPFATMIAVSFFKRKPGGFYTPDFVFDNYARFLSVFFGGVLGFSLMLAVLVAVCCVVIALPFTYLLTKAAAPRADAVAGGAVVGAVAVGSHHRLCLVDAVFAHRRHHQPVRGDRADGQADGAAAELSARC